MDSSFPSALKHQVHKYSFLKIQLSDKSLDFAVLMIAIHSALYIFRPKTGSEGGLYPYRHIAYTGWVIFPLLMASLAFVNDRDAYVSEGTYCYLPVRPFWYRLSLSWVPRYILFIVILGIYASIYYYVRYKFHGFTRTKGHLIPNGSQASGGLRPRPPKRNSLPPTPTLATHGLIPESRQASVTAADVRKPSTTTLAAQRLSKARPISPMPKISVHSFMWTSFSAPNNFSETPSESSGGDADSFSGPSTPLPISDLTFAAPASQANGSVRSLNPSQSRASSWRDGFVHRYSPTVSDNQSDRPTIIDLITVLRHHPDDSDSIPSNQLRLVNSRGQTYADAEMLRTRDKVRRQLRFLFIYPLVYIGMWILPLVSHVLQYDDSFAINSPFGLTCLTTICICSQAAVDCWLFSTREKPWRHVPGSDGHFWSSLKFWTGWKGVGEGRTHHGPGKTRYEMVREARAAYQRRDEELAARRGVSLQLSAIARQPARKAERSWWETSGHDGTMSPVTEEPSNPMEDVAVPALSDEEGGQEETSDGSRTLIPTETTRSLEVEEKPVIIEHHLDSDNT